jgi:carbon-monoxide dehydrogenase medium subunit
MEFHSLGTEEEALERLSQLGDDARILAGGTDLVLQHRRGEARAGAWLFIGRLERLRRIVDKDDAIEVGALVTHRMLMRHATIARRHDSIATAAATVGGWQTQAVGTIGGNVCNASPAADLLPPLLVAEAEIHLASVAGERTTSLEAFVLDRRRVDRRPDELVTGLRLPAVPPRTGEVYLKVAPRAAMEVALVGLAVRITLTSGGILSDARVAVGAVASRAFRARSAERALVDGDGRPEAVAEAGRLLADEARPIDDARATARYRRLVLPGLLARAVSESRERAAAA